MATSPAEPAHGLLARLWHTPRRTWARRVLFQVHLWLGVGLGVYTLVIGLTGSALVFRPELERARAPQLFTVAAGEQKAPLTGMVHAIEAQWPGEHVEGVDDLNLTGQPEIFYLAAPGGALAPSGGEQRMVYADRVTGRVLGSRLRFSGVLGVCANLHYYLLAGQTGYLMNGVCACAFLVLCLTGWLLWWPGSRSMRRSVRVHWGARWRRLNFDLHAVFGFWTNPMLIAVVATGVLFVFPKPVLGALAWLDGGHTAAARAWLTTPKPSASPRAESGMQSEAALISPDAALATARAALRAEGSPDTVHYLSLATLQFAMYDAIAYPPGVEDYAMPAYVYVDGRTGHVAAVHDARRLPRLMQWATYAYAVHFGSFGGVATRVLWVLLGLLPAGLWSTGLLLWWNRVLRPRLAVRRKG